MTHKRDTAAPNVTDMTPQSAGQDRRNLPADPTTEAGRRLLTDLFDPTDAAEPMEDTMDAWDARIAAIEAEAVAAYKARLRERVEALPDPWPVADVDSEDEWRDKAAVLDAIEQERPR
jgi:hypothetical protein